MSTHIYRSPNAPSAAPTSVQLGTHWVKTTEPLGHWLAIGTADVSDWLDLLNIGGGGGSGESNTLVSQGSGTSLVGTKVGTALGVKSLVAGTNISIDATEPGQLLISAAGGGDGEANTLLSQGGGTSLVGTKEGTQLGILSLLAGDNVTIDIFEGKVRIASTGGGGGGGGSGEANVLVDLGSTGWTVVGPKDGANLGVYGIGNGNGLVLDQPENDIMMYVQPMNPAQLPVYLPTIPYVNRVVPMVGYPGGIGYLTSETEAQMFPILINNKRVIGSVTFELDAPSAGTVLRIGMYSSDPRTNMPSVLVFDKPYTLSSGETFVELDLSTEDPDMMPGIHWILVWASVQVTLKSIPKVEAPAFGQRNYAIYPGTIDSVTALEPLINISFGSSFAVSAQVPHFTVSTHK